MTTRAGELSEAELVRAAGAGDPDAWNRLVRRYDGLLRARTRAYGLQDADAQDAIQGTWMRLFEHLHEIQHPDRLAGWLSTTIRRECLKILGHQQRFAGMPLSETLVDPVHGPERQVLAAESASRVRAEVEELPPGCRTVIRQLFGPEPASYAQVAGRVGIPIGSVGPTRGRALTHLRRRFDRTDLEATG
jgi:RNA polymerase sigma factor (sigma-70 family)